MLDGRLKKKCDEAQATPGKTVVVVEGTGDIAFLNQMLDKPPLRKRNYFAKFVLLDAGGKDAVLKILADRPHFRAMVDRDTWSDAACEKNLKKYPNLHILPRYCIENFIICPEELNASLPNFEEAASEIALEIPNAIRHGCFWRSAQPLYQELMELGFNRALMKYPPPDEKQMREMVQSWQELLSVDNIEKELNCALNGVKDQSYDHLLRAFCHGKVFFQSVVAPYVKNRFPGENTEGLKRKLYRQIKLPEDLLVFLEEVFKQ